MQLIVVGCGKVGSRLAHIMSLEGHDVVIIDNDRDSFKKLSLEYNGLTITGVPFDQDVLKQAGIESADALAAVTPDDNINIMVSQVAKEIFGIPKVLARIYNPEREHVFHQFGLDTICPTNITVDVIRSKIMGDAGISDHNIAGTQITFKHMKAEKSDNGKKLQNIKVGNNEMVFGIIRNGSFVFAGPDIKLGSDDIIVVAEQK